MEPSARTTQGRVPEGIRSFKYIVGLGRHSQGPTGCPCGERQGSEGTKSELARGQGERLSRVGMAGGGKDNMAEP